MRWICAWGEVARRGAPWPPRQEAPWGCGPSSVALSPGEQQPGGQGGERAPAQVSPSVPEQGSSLSGRRACSLATHWPLLEQPRTYPPPQRLLSPWASMAAPRQADAPIRPGPRTRGACQGLCHGFTADSGDAQKVGPGSGGSRGPRGAHLIRTNKDKVSAAETLCIHVWRPQRPAGLSVGGGARESLG